MKKYSIYLLSGIFLILVSLSLFNWFINPYDLFSSPGIEGLNKYKSEVERHTRLSKVYQVDKIKPDAVLLASSRGLVVPENMFAPEGMTGFNLSLTSASTYELARVLQHAHMVKPLKRVVLALDESFTDDKQPSFIEGRLAVDYDGVVTEGRLMQRLQDMFSGLLSYDALKASLRTIRKQGEFFNAKNENNYRSERVKNAGGHRQMFRTMESSVFSGYSGTEDLCGNKIAIDENKDIQKLSSFEKIVELAYSNDIDLYVYFSPSHARLYEVKCMIGKSAGMRKMKLQVVDIIEKMAEKYDREAFSVWDFSGYNVITTEAIPELEDSSSLMRWYWEGSHYTQETARLLFEKMFGLTDEYQGFGVKITSANIYSHLEEIESQRASYISDHSKDMKELHDLFDVSRSRK